MIKYDIINKNDGIIRYQRRKDDDDSTEKIHSTVGISFG